MRKLLLILLYICLLQKSPSQTLFSQYPVYDSTGLGVDYTKTASVFRIWSPTAEEAQLILYKDGEGGEPYETAGLQKGESGTWYIRLPGDWKNTFYTFRVKINNQWSNEVTDPYARAAGVNGKRAIVIDLDETNPPGWANDKSPEFSKDGQATNAIIYELHIRDASIHSSSGILQKGKFAGLTESRTTNKDGLATGLDHLKELCPAPLGKAVYHVFPGFAIAV